MKDLVVLLQCFLVIEGFSLSWEETFEGIYIRSVIFQPSTLMFFSFQ